MNLFAAARLQVSRTSSPLSASSTHSPALPRPRLHRLLSVSVDAAPLGTSRARNHTVFVLCLARFAEHNILSSVHVTACTIFF